MEAVIQKLALQIANLSIALATVEAENEALKTKIEQVNKKEGE